MSHTFTKLLYHFIFSTKERRPQIKPILRNRLYSYISGILKQHHGRLIKAGGTADHIHLFVELDSTVSVSEVMRVVKANSSKWMHETYPDAGAFAWQTGYAAFSVSRSVADDVVRYIEEQESHHRTRSFDEEFGEFLLRHDLDYEERYPPG